MAIIRVSFEVELPDDVFHRYEAMGPVMDVAEKLRDVLEARDIPTDLSINVIENEASSPAINPARPSGRPRGTKNKVKAVESLGAQLRPVSNGLDVEAGDVA